MTVQGRRNRPGSVSSFFLQIRLVGSGADHSFRASEAGIWFHHHSVPPAGPNLDLDLDLDLDLRREAGRVDSLGFAFKQWSLLQDTPRWVPPSVPASRGEGTGAVALSG